MLTVVIRLVTLTLFFSVTYASSLPEKIQQQIHRWGKNIADFSPQRPTVLFAFNLPTSISCGVAGMKHYARNLQQLARDANFIIAIETDSPEEILPMQQRLQNKWVVADTGYALRNIFHIQNFPTLLIIDTSGNETLRIVDPAHHFPPPSVLIRHLPPKPLPLEPYHKLIRTPKGMIAPPQLADLAPLSISSTALLAIDKIFGRLVVLDLRTNTWQTVWQFSDSFRFHPFFRPYPIDRWDSVQSLLGLPFAIPSRIVQQYAHHSPFVLIRCMVPSHRKDRLIEQLLLWVSFDSTWNLKEIHPLPYQPLPDLNRFFFYQHHFYGIRADSSGYRLYYCSLQDTTWHPFSPPIFPEAKNIPAEMQQASYEIRWTFTSKYACLYAINFSAFPFLKLYFQSSPKAELDTLHQFIGLAARYQKAFFATLASMLQEVLTQTGAETLSQLSFEELGSLLPLNDSTVVFFAPITDTTGPRGFAIQILNPESGIQADLLFQPPKHPPQDQLRYYYCAITPDGILQLLTKRRKSGWHLYSIPLSSWLKNL